MSVEFETRIGFGYIMPKAERDEMIAVAASKGLESEVEDEFHCLDSWAGESDYFLGEYLKTVNMATAIALTEAIPADFDADIFCNKYQEILEICGVDITLNSKWTEPKLYVMGVVF